MIDTPLPMDDRHVALIHLKMKNDEGFPVTITMPSIQSVLDWVVVQDGFVIEHSTPFIGIYDPVQLTFGAKETKILFMPIMLEKRKYKTSVYTLKSTFWGVASETKFFVQKIDLNGLSKEAQPFADKHAKEFASL